jgi:hypothetical protein
MIISESQILKDSLNKHLLFESKKILFENIINNPKHYFIINEDYKKYCTEEEWEVIQEGIWDTIKDIGSKISDYASTNPREMIQTVADIASIFDPTGLIDLVNGIFYYHFKDYFSAFFSFLGSALTMGGLLLTATVAGAAAGVPMEIAGKAVQTTKVAIKSGKIANAGIKEVGVATKMARPALAKIAGMISNIPFVGGIGRWLLKSSDNVASVALKDGAKADDIAKALNSTSTEISNNPVVKGFTERVINIAKSQALKPSMLQTGFAGLGTYALWANIDENSLRKVAIAQLSDAYAKEGMKFDPNESDSKMFIDVTMNKLKKEKYNCKTEEECKSNLEKIIQQYPSVGTVLQSLNKFGESGAQLIKQTAN